MVLDSRDAVSAPVEALCTSPERHCSRLPRPCFWSPPPWQMAASPSWSWGCRRLCRQRAKSFATPQMMPPRLAPRWKRLGFDTDIVLDPNKSTFDAGGPAVWRTRRRSRCGAVLLRGSCAVAREARTGSSRRARPSRKRRDLPLRDIRCRSPPGPAPIGAARLSVIILDADAATILPDGGSATSGASAARAGLAQLRRPQARSLSSPPPPALWLEDGTGEHSPFTAALLHQIEVPGRKVRNNLRRGCREVREATHRTSDPVGESRQWRGSLISGPAQPATPAKTVATVVAGANRRGRAWRRPARPRTKLNCRSGGVSSTATTPRDFREYLAKFLGRGRVRLLASPQTT